MLKNTGVSGQQNLPTGGQQDFDHFGLNGHFRCPPVATPFGLNPVRVSFHAPLMPALMNRRPAAHPEAPYTAVSRPVRTRTSATKDGH